MAKYKLLHDPRMSHVLGQILSLLPRNVINSGGKVEQKRKEISWIEKSRGRTLIAVLTFFFGRTFDLRREIPGLG